MTVFPPEHGNASSTATPTREHVSVEAAKTAQRHPVRRLVWPLCISIVCVAVVVLLVYGITHQSPSRTLDEAIAQGRPAMAPDASRSLPSLSGHGSMSLASLRGKVVVLNFWASWCEPCQEEAPTLERLQQEIQHHDATVVGVTYRDTTPDSREFVSKYHLTYPNFRDVDGTFAPAFGTDQLPESFVINRAGRVVAISRGEIGQPFVAEAIKVARES